MDATLKIDQPEVLTVRTTRFDPIAAALLVIAAACVSAGARADERDLLLLDAGDFQIQGGESKILVNRKEPKAIRVCVTRGPEAVALSVRYDQKTGTITPGKCMVVDAKFVRIEPAAELKEDEILIGKFEPAR